MQFDQTTIDVPVDDFDDPEMADDFCRFAQSWLEKRFPGATIYVYPSGSCSGSLSHVRSDDWCQEENVRGSGWEGALWDDFCNNH